MHYALIMKVGQLKNLIVERLEPVVGAGEARAMMRETMLDALGYDQTALIVNADREVTDQTVAHVQRVIERIEAGEPLQYILGHAYFMGMDLEVNPSVLIPRPETAGLVDLVTDRYAGVHGLRVLDVGTGSGCIAIALARALPFADATAVDISPDAVKVAAANAHKLKARTDCRVADALTGSGMGSDYDVIVSNPPYICESERPAIEPRVKDHEPAGALFVADDDPLRFYRAIARFALDGGLKTGGHMFFEINPMQAVNLQSMLKQMNLRDVELLRDYRGAVRYAVCAL